MTNMDYYYAGQNFAPEKRTLTDKEIFAGVLEAAQGDDTMPAPYPWLTDKLPAIVGYVASMVPAVMQQTALEFKQNGISDDDTFVQIVLTRCAWAGVGITLSWREDYLSLYECDPDTQEVYSFIMGDEPVSNIAKAVTQNLFVGVNWTDEEVMAVNDYLENVSCFAYGAAGKRFVKGTHPELQAYAAMFVYGIIFCLTYVEQRKENHSFSWIELTVDREKRGGFLVPMIPKAESDFSSNADYSLIYRSIGLGAPVRASVYTTQNNKLMPDHAFSYTLVGNSLSLSDFQDFLQYMKGCELIHLHQAPDCLTYLYASASQDEAHRMYVSFSNVANIGAYEGKDPRSGKYIVKLEFYPQPSLEK